VSHLHPQPLQYTGVSRLDVQELMLSPRIIRFEANQVLWECRTAEYEDMKVDHIEGDDKGLRSIWG
jgi:hypothetical protein